MSQQSVGNCIAQLVRECFMCPPSPQQRPGCPSRCYLFSFLAPDRLETSQIHASASLGASTTAVRASWESVQHLQKVSMGKKHWQGLQNHTIGIYSRWSFSFFLLPGLLFFWFLHKEEQSKNICICFRFATVHTATKVLAFLSACY